MMNDAHHAILGERTFLLEDQIQFAEFANDWNPIHVDLLYARRSLTGQAVVHGVHVLLWALECWAKNSNATTGIVHIDAQFTHPVLLGKHVVCNIQDDEESQITITVSYVTGEEAAAIHLTVGESQYNLVIQNRDKSFENDNPTSLGVDELDDASGVWELAAVPGLTEKLFPSLTNNIGEAFILILAQTSHLVGMKCPGLNSLFTELELDLDQCTQKSTDFRYRVLRVDHRFNLVTIEVNCGGYSGKVRSFFRPPPCKQATMEELGNCVSNTEFSGQKALVIGGSRGLGELTSKLLAAGGADVCITYHQGKTEADAVTDEITNFGASVRAISFDIQTEFDPEKVLPADWRPTHLYYFATPFIFEGKRKGFSTELFSKFSTYYVSGFAKLTESLCETGLESVFYPSTVALDELPADMAEYCAAKAAGEKLCQLLMNRHKELTIYFPRLPRLATDQTASLLPVKNLDPLSVLLEVLRASLGKR